MHADLPHPLWGILLVMTTMTGLTLGLSRYQRRCRPSAEWVRKLMHMGGGLTALSFPWLFAELWPVALLAALLMLQFVAMRFVPRIRASLGGVLGDVRRRSVGEFCFPLAVLLLFGLTAGDPALYCAPLMSLTFADTAAALAGRRWGVLPYAIGGGTKSVEGSCAFFAASGVCYVATLWLLGPLNLSDAVVVACLVAPLLTVVEAVAGYGLDNLLIPLCGFAFLTAAQEPPFCDIDFSIPVIAIVAGPLLLWGTARRVDQLLAIGGSQ